MNKREVQEIKKQFTPENCTITRIAGCYVDGEKEKKMEDEQAFLSLPEEEMFKYFDIFRKTLSGNIGKTLLNMQYMVDTERSGDPEGYEHELLMNLRESKLKDPALLDEFYEQIITSYVYPGNYYIILIHGAYDIPGKAKDGTMMEDASDEVYDFILCSICQVKLSKAGLSYNYKEEKMQERMRDWVVDKPDKGFLFPTFNERSTDVHEILYYTKKSSDIQEEFVNSVLGSKMTVSADEQKEMFNGIVENVLGENADCETVKDIHQNIYNAIIEHGVDPEPYKIGKDDMRKIFEDSNVLHAQMANFDRIYDEYAGEKTEFMATNIVNPKKLKVEFSEGKMELNADFTDYLDVQVVDGQKCVVIPISNMKINGICVKDRVSENEV